MIEKIEVPDTVSLPKGSRACRRKADELRAAHQLHRKIVSFAEGKSDLPRNQPLPGQHKLFDEDELSEKKLWASELTGDTHKALSRAFDKLEAGGPWRNVAKAPPPTVLDPLHQDFPNFDGVTRLIQQRLVLNRLAQEKPISLPPILLNGPAGVGKTAYCQRLAGLLGLRFEKIDLSSATTNFSLTGLDAGYNNGNPGRIWASLQHDNISVLWLLDEVDKVERGHKDGGNNHLLGLLEPVSSKRFVDNCTLLAIDASWICYIATSNYKAQIDAPLLSRFEVFDIQAPDPQQVQAIVRSIYRDIRESEAWGPCFSHELDDSVICALSALTPREIRRRLFDAFAAAAEQARPCLLASDIKVAHGNEENTQRRIGFI